ncbi:hypothetical protein CVT24_002964 [Panaeolus cyanescens]|uniref:Endo-1,4-beta-xylanase n=1 Tax=Panaeolus cyanescens TaxID=181874 RepID=A0A409X3V6_9AGAR|nr:hypothetical protein CVT24_002964 [Panaeolus cyanescens]
MVLQALTMSPRPATVSSSVERDGTRGGPDSDRPHHSHGGGGEGVPPKKCFEKDVADLHRGHLLGWNPGSSSRTINYNGTYAFTGNSYLALWGWTRSPLIEYYVVESYGLYNPSSAAQKKGTVYCDGADYDILQATIVNQPSIDGVQTFQQYWSVRNPKKNPGGAISGSVTFGCHVNAWRNIGMNLGAQHIYQIVATEAHFSSGYAQITVS